MSLYYTKRRPSHNLMYTVDHTYGYCRKKFIRAYPESCTHAHGMKSEAEILNILKQLWDWQGNRCFHTVFIYLGFYVAFNTVQVISRRVVGRAEETST